MIKKKLIPVFIALNSLLLFSCNISKDNLEVSNYIRENCSYNSDNKAVSSVTEYQEDELKNYDLNPNDFEAINKINENEEYYTKYIKYETKGGIDELNNYGQYDRQLYPGALVDISKPAIGDIHLKPSSRKLSISLESTTNESSYRPYVVNNPSLSETRVGVSKLVNSTKDKIASLPTKLSMKVNTASNSDEFKIALGLTIDSSFVKIKDEFSFDTYNSSKSLILVLTQVYYTIDVDSKITPSQYFSSDLTTNEIINGLKGTLPAMVSSVSYGRIAVVKLTSNDSLSSIENDLNASGSYMGAVEAGVTSNIQSKIEANRIQSEVLVYGGTLEDGSPIGTNMSFDEMITEFSKQYSPNIASAVPISYRLSYICDGRDAKVMMTNEPTYIKVYCPKYSVLDLEVKKLEILDKNKNTVNSSLLFKAEDYIKDLQCGATYVSKNSSGTVLDEKYTKESDTSNENKEFLNKYSINKIYGINESSTIDFTQYKFSIYGIDNSKIVKNGLLSLFIHVKFDIITTREEWGTSLLASLFYGGKGISFDSNTASVNITTEIKNLDVFTSIDGFYADFTTSSNGGIFRIYFETQMN